MSPNNVRCGVRIGAAGLGLISVAIGGYAVRAGRTDEGTVLDGMTFMVVVAGVWLVVEAIVGGFEAMQRTTRERYERLQAQQPEALAIAGQAVCETLRQLREQAEEDSPKVSVLHR